MNSYLPEGVRNKQKRPPRLRSLFKFNPGGDLLSHTVTSAVPSALEDFTSVFGMGTGVTPSGITTRKLKLLNSAA